LFKDIKNIFTKRPILKIYQPELPTRVETDTSDFAIKTCLLQKHNKIWHPVAYYSQKMTLLKLNYDIYNRKLLRIIITLKE